MQKPLEKPFWKEGRFYTFESTPDGPGDPTMKATITVPGAHSALELLLSVADIPLIGAPFGENEMEKAKEIGELLVIKFWPSDQAVKAIVALMAQDEIGEEGPE